jgi:hypothetical protein
MLGRNLAITTASFRQYLSNLLVKEITWMETRLLEETVGCSTPLCMVITFIMRNLMGLKMEAT